MDDIIAALMAFAMSKMGVTQDIAYPEIDLRSPCEIAQLYSPGYRCESDQIHAVSLYRDGVIYLPDNVNWGDPGLVYRGYLVHEIVHHIQYEIGVEIPAESCIGQTIEWPAYQIEFAYLREHGVEDVNKFSGLAPAFLSFVTSCPEPRYKYLLKSSRSRD